MAPVVVRRAARAIGARFVAAMWLLLALLPEGVVMVGLVIVAPFGVRILDCVDVSHQYN